MSWSYEENKDNAKTSMKSFSVYKEKNENCETEDYSSECDIAKHIESCEDCGFCKVRDNQCE